MAGPKSAGSNYGVPVGPVLPFHRVIGPEYARRPGECRRTAKGDNRRGCEPKTGWRGESGRELRNVEKKRVVKQVAIVGTACTHTYTV